MAIGKTTFGDSLERTVVLANSCLGCAACAVACPFSCLEHAEGIPRLVNECKACGICANVCPQFDWKSSKAETCVFGRERREKEEFGVCRRITVAKASDDEIMGSCQDGGVVTALLQHALETKVIDGAIVSGISKQRPLYPVAKLVTTACEVLECAGTRYSYSPNLLALPDAVKQKRKSVAFVGTPCQISALRRMQMCRLKLAANVKVLVGLMCSESFTYEGLVERHLHGKLGIDLDDVKGMNIKGKLIVRLKSGSSKIIPLSDVKQYARGSCRFCKDFSAELADVSVGGLGLEGWTFTVMRTKEGEDFFGSALECGRLKTRRVDDDDPALKLLVKLSSRKRRLVV
jgi:coenzyme F420 hydrogenase subunit beta